MLSNRLANYKAPKQTRHYHVDTSNDFKNDIIECNHICCVDTKHIYQKLPKLGSCNNLALYKTFFDALAQQSSGYFSLKCTTYVLPDVSNTLLFIIKLCLTSRLDVNLYTRPMTESENCNVLSKKEENRVKFILLLQLRLFVYYR